MCVRRFDIEFPTLVDRMDFSVETYYTVWPERMHLVDADGAIVHKNGPGAYGFDPDELEEAIPEELTEQTPRA